MEGPELKVITAAAWTHRANALPRASRLRGFLPLTARECTGNTRLLQKERAARKPQGKCFTDLQIVGDASKHFALVFVPSEFKVKCDQGSSWGAS
jgi:hypothetical protein